jgi:hypothetical protein
VRPCFWPSTGFAFQDVAAASHPALIGPSLSRPWDTADSNDGSKMGLKVACGHTPTHSLYARSPSQALVGLLHKCSTSTPFLPSSHPLPSLPSELSQGLSSPVLSCLSSCLSVCTACCPCLVVVVLQRIQVCSPIARLPLRQSGHCAVTYSLLRRRLAQL